VANLLGAARRRARGLAILPYIFEVFAQKFAVNSASIPMALVVAMQLLHLLLIFGLATGIGLLAPKAGIELPYLQRWSTRRRRKCDRTPSASP